jgi:hypothetical protein
VGGVFGGGGGCWGGGWCVLVGEGQGRQGLEGPVAQLHALLLLMRLLHAVLVHPCVPATQQVGCERSWYAW